MKTSHSRHVLFVVTLILVACGAGTISAQARLVLSRSGVVVDERLAILRIAPGLTAQLSRRLSRGRRVFILGAQRNRDGILFYRVAVTRRTRGWIQAEALVWPLQKGEAERLLRLIEASHDFDRIVRARIFLDVFPRSPLRPKVLLMFGDEANMAAQKLSRDAARRLDAEEMRATGASLSSFYLSYSGLDRYRRQGIVFRFDEASRQFRYDGAAWLEVIRRYGGSAEAEEVRRRRCQMLDVRC